MKGKGTAIVVIVTLALVGGLVWGIVASVRASNEYDRKHPLECISKQKLVNQTPTYVGDRVEDYTLTFQNGQVLQKSQLSGYGDLKLGNTYCVAWARK